MNERKPRVGDKDFVQLSVTQAALLLGVSVSELKEAIRAGRGRLTNGRQIPPHHLVGTNRTTYRFMLHDIESLEKMHD